MNVLISKKCAYFRLPCVFSKTGVGKLFTRMATLEKNLKPSAALIGKEKKVITSVDVPISTKYQVESKKKVITSADVPIFHLILV